MTGISKSFNKVRVLSDVVFNIYKGECVGLLGENGAGKSTLMKILCGVYSKDSGVIRINGQEVEMNSVEDAQKLGIRIIYQELSLFPSLSVVDNIFINNEICQHGSRFILANLNKKDMRKRAEHILKDVLSVDIDLFKKVENIPFSQRQIVEIARAVNAESSLVIMDEPTTGLERKEKIKLFKVIEDLKAAGTSVIFISHHLDEVMQVCDRAVVLRDGHVVNDTLIKDTQVQELVTSMIGKNLNNYYPRIDKTLGKEILRVQNLNSKSNYHDISFSLKEKEVLGIVGLAGCGKNELIRSLFGITAYDSGDIIFKDRKIGNRTVREAMNNKFAFLPAERKTEGIFKDHNVAWNMTISALDRIKQKGRLSRSKEESTVNEYIDKFQIKVSSIKQLISRLSGGNQQKVMLSRWFLTDPEILLLEEPTRGIDVNAKVEVCEFVNEFVSKGKSVILVSSEEAEVIGMCDRILVLHDGKIAAELDADKTNIEEIKAYATNILHDSKEA